MQIIKSFWTKISPKMRRAVSGVIVLFDEDADINETEWMKAASGNEVFDFLNDEDEDIYTLEDGKPIEKAN